MATQCSEPRSDAARPENIGTKFETSPSRDHRAPPVPLPQIPLPNSAEPTRARIPFRRQNHAGPSFPAARTPAPGRWQLPSLPCPATRCDQGPFALGADCGTDSAPVSSSDCLLPGTYFGSWFNV
ncbi:hypothetical protein LBMAG56_25480 [Verrucomicrobiota bacterium]|nr:hypothetical protein LBMAG56_25480 [Verrucomicrobiota bacterium]